MFFNTLHAILCFINEPAGFIGASESVLVTSTRRSLPPKLQEFRMIQTKQSGFPYSFKIAQSLGK